ncbi:MAG: hypothetical protein LBV28_05490, partial [Puniceicoccales bacterium]|nr:hypothetical protein [Puniceicoccales bacterium]
ATLEKRLSLQTLEESTDTTTELTQLRRYQAESARQREAINIRATKYFAARKTATPDAPFELLQRSPWVAALMDHKTERILPLVIFE